MTTVFYTPRGQTFHLDGSCSRLTRSTDAKRTRQELPKRKNSKLVFTAGRGKSAQDFSLRRCTFCG